MYAVKYTLDNGQNAYLGKTKKGEYKISDYREDITEFDDEYEAIDAGTETAKKEYGKNIDITLLWHA